MSTFTSSDTDRRPTGHGRRLRAAHRISRAAVATIIIVGFGAQPADAQHNRRTEEQPY
jgi:hypothetical protein